MARGHQLLGLGIVVSLLVATGALPVRADDDLPGTIEGWGRLGKALDEAGTVYELTLVLSGKGRRKKSVQIFVEIPRKAKLLVDQRRKLEDVKAKEGALILGRKRDLPVRDPQGIRQGRDRQIVNVKAVFLGEGLKAKEHKDPRDPAAAWWSGEVPHDGAKGLWLHHEGEDYKVIAGRAPIIRREEADRELLRRGRYVWIRAMEKTGVRPPVERDRDLRPFYEASQTAILDPALLTKIYPLMF